MAQPNNYTMGKMPTQFAERTKTIEFIITEDCNLRCSYCYLVSKNNNKKMDFDVAKRAVDYILTDRSVSNTPGVVWAMAGGEALLEIDMIDRITEYIKHRSKELNHPWSSKYTISIGTNGLLYNDPKVQNYIKKNYCHLNMAMTIDGTKEKHDKSRVFADGSGSYDIVIENAKLWLKQFPSTQKVTKATFSHDDLPYLKDSVINLWNTGIQYVMANVVFENVWQDGDDILFEKQLMELADYTLEHGLWKNYSVRFFDPSMGFPLTDGELKKGFCGSGKNMLVVDSEGKIYPCIRFTGFSLEKKDALPIGDIYKGIDKNKLRIFNSFSTKSISKKECLDCDNASVCSYCGGANYDSADTDTVFQRATHICKMHKANVQACEYFWDRFKEVTGLESMRDQIKAERNNVKRYEKAPRFLLFLLNDAITPHCRYSPKRKQTEEMSSEIYKLGINFARENDFIPVFLGDSIHRYEISDEDIVITSPLTYHTNENSMVVFDENSNNADQNRNGVIFLLTKNTVSNLYDRIYMARAYIKKMNIIIKDILEWSQNDVLKYEEQLDKITDLVVNDAKKGFYYEINVLTDRMKLNNMNNCDAGEDSYTLAPNGMIYICPAFYFDQPTNTIGSLETGINIKNFNLLTLENAPICSVCDAYQCNRCKFLNYKSTGEINTPSGIQCILSHMERNATRKLQLMLKKENMLPYMEILPELGYADPIELLMQGN